MIRRSWDQARLDRGLTLIELLLVTAMVVLLVLLILPAVQESREATRRARCGNNLKQIGLAIHQYSLNHESFPLGWGGPTTGHSFLVAILPYLDQKPLDHLVDFRGPLCSTVVRARLDTLICPSDGLIRTNPIGTTNYAGNRGSGVQAFGYNGAFGLDEPIRPRDFTDGMSHTAAVCEWLIGPSSGGIRDTRRSVFSTGLPLAEKDQLDQFALVCRSLDVRSAPLSPATIGAPWTHGDFGHTLYNHTVAINHNSCLNGTLWQQGAWTAKSNHPHGVNLLFADGHVKFLVDSIDMPLWRAMGSRDGGKITKNQGRSGKTTKSAYP